jgi:hypothetical protein
MQNRPVQPPATPVAEGRRQLLAAGFNFIVGLNTTQNRGELWQRENEPPKFISYMGEDADFFSTESLNAALGIPFP